MRRRRQAAYGGAGGRVGEAGRWSSGDCHGCERTLDGRVGGSWRGGRSARQGIGHSNGGGDRG